MEGSSYPITATVGTSSVLVLDSPGVGKRVDLVITNVGAVTAYLAVGADAILNSGLALYPGTTIMFSRSAGYEVMNQQVRAISSGAGTTLSIWVRSE